MTHALEESIGDTNSIKSPATRFTTSHSHSSEIRELFIATGFTLCANSLRRSLTCSRSHEYFLLCVFIVCHYFRSIYYCLAAYGFHSRIVFVSTTIPTSATLSPLLGILEWVRSRAANDSMTRNFLR